MKTVLKKIGAVSAGKVIGVLFAIGGLIRALAYILLPHFYNFGVVGVHGAMVYSIGLLSIIIFPIIGAIMGFIFGAVVAVLYNFIAPRVGGIKLEMK